MLPVIVCGADVMDHVYVVMLCLYNINSACILMV